MASLPLGSVASCESQELSALPDRDILELSRGLQWAVKDGEMAARYQPDMEVNLSQLIGLFQRV